MYRITKSREIKIIKTVRHHLGLKLCELRASNHLTQEEMACKLKLPLESLQKYELGMEVPSFETLCRIALFYEKRLNISFE